MNEESLNTKISISTTAVSLFQKGEFTIPKLVKATDNSASEIFALFPTKTSILQYYYPSLIVRYKSMVAEIEDFDEYTISEKLSNFIYTLFDIMDEDRSFIESTFADYQMTWFTETDFHREIDELFKVYFRNDSQTSLAAALFMGNYFYSRLRTQYLYLIRFWLHDTSSGNERTLALTDKFTAFVEEVTYSTIVDKGFDLAKYVLSSTNVIRNIPIVGSCISHIFENETEEAENGG